MKTDSLCLRKRDKSVVPFDSKRIEEAIIRAGSATNEFDSVVAKEISDALCDEIMLIHEQHAVVEIENVQNLVEQALMKREYYKTMKEYILYREKRRQQRELTLGMIDVRRTMEEYLEQSDWRVHANANQGYSLGGLILNTSGKLIANYWLNNVYSERVRDAHKNGSLHIHDLDTFSGYCAGWSLRQLLEEGFNGVPGKVESCPPKHLESAVGQMVNFLGTLQNEWAGAQAFSSFDTYLAPFIKKDNLPQREVYQAIQQFVFNLNVPSRWGMQTPFTNITIDWICPKDMKDINPVIGGVEQKFTYGDCQKEMDMLNKAFIEVMTEGDAKGRIFTFPIPTYNITKDFDWENPNVEGLFTMTAKYGIPYFQNFINSSLDPSDVRSMCCRLQLDLRELRARGGGLFGSGEMTGSIGVVTINLPRIGIKSKSEKEFMELLDDQMDIAMESLEIKRKVVQKNIERGLLPYTKRYLPYLHNHFATIGINGMNEALLNFIKKDIATKEGSEFAEKVLAHIRKRLADFQELTGNLYNLEATPAEGTTYRFAKEDLKRFPNIIHQGPADAPYYTNSSHLPVEYTDDPIRALDHQDKLQTAYTGGTVLHLFLGEKIRDWKACRSFARRVAENYHLPYFTITPTFSICPKHGYLIGEQTHCPSCNQICEVWSRIVGYFRPVSEWNKGKKSEYSDRIEYAVPSTTNV